MNAYRKRFIQLNMCLIGSMLFLMLLSVGVYMTVDYYRELHNAMKQVVEPFKSVSAPMKRLHTEKDEPRENETKGTKKRSQRLRTINRKAITTLLYTAEDQSVSVLSSGTETEMEETLLSEVLEQIAAADESYGILWRNAVIYYRAGNGEPYRIAIAPTAYIGDSVGRLALTLALIWTAAMLGFFVVSCYLSKLAAKPMEEAIAREKQFIADASHDLKTPLSVILANNSILRESRQESVASQIKWIESTETAAKNMQQLIQEMLTLSALEQHPAEKDLPLVDFSAIVTKSALQMESVAYEKGISLESEIAEHIRLRAAEDRLRRIAASLIENAIKYEPPSGTVSVTLKKRKKQIRLTVRNRHSVIAAEDLPYVFERFYRGDKSRRTQGSHGLGLAITKQMVENMGGKICVESEANSGTVFTVTFS